MADSNGASAFFFDGVATPAQDIRLGLAAVVGNGTPRAFGARGGSRPGSPVCTVSGTTVTIPPRSVTVDPQGTNVQGPYLVSWRASQTIALDPASSSNARIDVVYVRVLDGLFDGSGQQALLFGKVTGTAAGIPTIPAIPAGAAVIEYFTVPQSGGGAIVPVKGPVAVAAGGVQPAKDSTEYPSTANLSDGDAVLWDRALGDFVVRKGGQWSKRDTRTNPQVAGGVWAGMTNGSGNGTVPFPFTFDGTPGVSVCVASTGGGFTLAVLSPAGVSPTQFTFTALNNNRDLMLGANVTVSWNAVYQP